MMVLAINGGSAVWGGDWPQWPPTSETTLDAVRGVLSSGRWAVSGTWAGTQPLDISLGRRFAEYSGTAHCIPVDHGSSALVISLLATGVRPGDEVIVPGLTWVATASAVARIGAVPVLVDIDPGTLCISPAAVESAITSRTRAIIAVHLYSAMADMDSLTEICARYELALVEDCAQAYGARWGDRPAGSIGDAGAFSTQQGKALTAGEGGLLVTSRDDVRELAEMYRGDGRRYLDEAPALGLPSLTEFAEVQGWNMHLSELQAAVLLDGLERLESLDADRRRSATYLDQRIEASLGHCFQTVVPYARNVVRGYYQYALMLRLEQWQGIGIADVCEALSAELGLHAHVTYPPLNKHPLLDPRRLWGTDRVWDTSRFYLRQAELAQSTTVLVHHSALLAETDALDSIVDALGKVASHREELRRR